ncbi:pyruvate dehydrogenase, E2 component, dihydrolipoamide acetyltransferase [gamma proteobacterium HTCC5015]|nr:pyruvate dehydrogenase, E2 component, dihydrolipoamide acetyltransferase [gamma proteobacterium HTCC5015]
MTTTIKLPSIGDIDAAEVIEIMVSPGDSLEQESPILALETDKAAMEIPSPEAGTVGEVLVKVGDKLSEGDALLTLEVSDQNGDASKTQAENKPEDERPPQSPPESEPTNTQEPPPEAPPAASGSAPDPQKYQAATTGLVHAGPAVRKMARKLGADLSQVKGSGPRGRIVKEDVEAFVKQSLQQPRDGLPIAPRPSIDFSEFGDIETIELSKIQVLTGEHTHSAWLRIPHVTQFDRADITDLEDFRKKEKEHLAKREIKLTLLPFLIKAAVSALKAYPRVNSSLDDDGKHLIQKHYFHISIAVDTPYGLVVPVVRNADQKSLSELASEVADLAKRARARKLAGHEMKGGCFTLTSLGHIGGTGFTPIINEPEVAIMGISRAATEAVHNGKTFDPRLILPLSLSYDHRVIDGVLAAQFTRHFAEVLEDSRRLLI